ncbi:MAG TPA: tetrahydrofolate dehydrogenase/cyclohydrolase catalytic domain-containing protein, partial [Chloroflexota bacterium]|nr:tetrahydrofolate dehydrogenase/cyclohydrolase catalytic domain-containing protein [Chloroflexota bacterium]
MSATTARVLDGTALAVSIKASLAETIGSLRERGVVPGLGTVLVGDDPASATYVALKHRDCAEVGIASFRADLPASSSQADVFEAIVEFN